VDLAEVVSDTLRSLEVSLRHRGFHLTFESQAGPPVEAEVDTDAVAQAVANLVDNAVKYSDGAREITVRLAREGNEAVISVEDHGIGIAADEQDKIFERFHRVRTGLVHDVKGSGLGLSIVRHVVQAHAGRVRVASEPGRGSTFFIHLPLSAADRPDAAALTEVPADGV
jgi:signal transduction histidine kinase